jgi:hypothetical protein
LIVALEFERNVVGPSLGAFDKSVVESRHESIGYRSWGIYTKNIFVAEPARFAERPPNFRPLLIGVLGDLGDEILWFPSQLPALSSCI